MSETFSVVPLGYSSLTSSQDDEVDRENLQLILKAYMLRRTHEDTIFGHPILSMPDIGEKTFSIKFCKAERYLYRELTLRCVRDLFGKFKIGVLFTVHDKS